MASSNYLLLKQQLLRRHQCILSQMMPGVGAAKDMGVVEMDETRLYIGLNDSETKEQMFETERYLEELKKLCFIYHVPFSVGMEEGGYFHENGEYVEEKSLVLTLIDAEKEIIQKIAKDLCALFHQEAILVIKNAVQGCYIM